jgi:hypothetical protein
MIEILQAFEGEPFQLSGCESYKRGGPTGLASDIRKALSTGLSCWDRLGGKRREERQKILDLLLDSKKPVRVQCSRDVQAPRVVSTLPGDAGFPGMKINLDLFEKKPELETLESAVLSTLFHESVHWLGYSHSHGVDVAYLSELCCMSAPANTKACQLLQEKNLGASNEKYVRFFARELAAQGRMHVAWDAAWVTSFQSADGAPLYWTALEIEDVPKNNSETWREIGDPLIGISYTYAALKFGNLEKQAQARYIQMKEQFYPSSDPKLAARAQFAEEFGKALLHLLKKEPEGFGQNFVKSLSHELDCSRLSEKERDRVQEVITRTIFEFSALSPAPPESVQIAWRNLCR